MNGHLPLITRGTPRGRRFVALLGVLMLVNVALAYSPLVVSQAEPQAFAAPGTPKINLHKTIASSGRINASDQFIVEIKHGATVDNSKTTTGSGTGGQTGQTDVVAGTTYTLTDAMAPGSVSTIGMYTAVLSCSNSAPGATTPLPGGTGTSFTVTPQTGDNIDCDYTNTGAAPKLTLAKSVSSRVNAADQFDVKIKNGASTVATGTTSGAGTTATTGQQTLAGGTTYTLTDTMASGSVSAIGAYTSTIVCSNSTSGSTTTLPSGTGTSFSVTPKIGDVITCTFTNAAPAPKLTLAKSVASRANAADQFDVKIKNGASTVATGTTSGAGTTATTGQQTLVAGTTYTVTDTMASGSVSAIGVYTSSISCSNTNSGSSTTLPSGTGTSFSVTPASGDVITCTFTNGSAPPKLTLGKSVASRVVAADQFDVKIKNGASTVVTGTTSGAGTTASTGQQTLVAGTTYTLTDTMAAGSTSTLADYLSSISCTNSTSGSSTSLPSGTGTSFSVTPAQNDVISCTVTNTAKPHLTLAKSVASRANASDQFTVAVMNGASTVASASTSGAGTTASTGSQALTAATTYTLTDTMAGGSASVIGQYASSIACTNTNGSSSTTLPSGSGTSFSVTPANGDNITCTVTNTAGTASLGLAKNASPGTNVTVGDVITYTFGVTNTGNLPLTNVTVTDPMTNLSVITCTPAQGGTLAAAATMSCSATYTVTQADIDAGSIMNTATVSALDPSSNAVTKTANKTVTTAQSASLSLSKAALPNSGVVAGDIVTYTFGGKNTGSVTLHNVTVTDPMTGLSAVNCSPGTPATLAPNATIDCTATYTVTQADVDAGSFSNTATIAGLDPSNNPVSDSDGATVNTLRIGSATLSKDASPDTGVVAGDIVTYSLHGENTGTVTLHNVDVTDPMTGLSAVDCTPGTPASLAPGDTIDCTATYTVTQSDVDEGSFANTATLSGLEPTNVIVQANGSKTVLADQVSSIGLTKSASPNSGVVADDVVTYTISATNTGTVTLHGADVTDPMTGLSAIGCTPTAPATLAPGDSMDCTATYTVTQADVDNGTIGNTATVAALDPADAPVGDTANETVTASNAATLAVAKSASPNSGVVAGDIVTYTFSGQNTGAVTLHNVSVADPMTGLSAIDCTPTAPTTLAPGATIDCSATYTVTQADVDNGQIDNTATISGLDPTDAPTSSTGSTSVTADQTASFGFTKTASPTGNVAVGDVITYTFTGTNSGAVTLNGVDVSDPMTGLSAIDCTPTAPATLAPGATIDCSATYTVTQADVDNGQIDNTATISGTDPSSDPVSTTAGASVTTDQTASVSLTKTGSPSSGLDVGDTVTYTMVATNDGQVSLHGVDVTDPMTGLSAIGCTPTAPATLASGDSMTCTATYTVTQNDVDNGQIDNTATVDALTPADAPVTDSASETVLTGQPAGITIVKTASPNTDVAVGDQITYGFAVTNSGGLTLHGVDVTDPMTGLSAIDCTPVAPATLAPGATMDCSATYTATQADVDAGSIVNTATVAALDPADNPVTDSDSATVEAAQTDHLTFTKTASPSGSVSVGDVITYTMTVTNDGTVTVDNTVIADPMAGLSPLDCTPAQGATLVPGDAMTCTATYTVTDADIARGSIDNTATVTADGINGHGASNASTAVVPTESNADVSLVKKLDSLSGDTATWLITVTNSGTGALPGPFTVTDQLPNGLTYVSATGDGWTCTGTETIRCTHDADLAAGADTSVTVVTKVIGTGKITNTASMDVLGESVTAGATVTPTESGGFAFTGAEVTRWGLIGLLLVVGGWFLLGLARKRDEDQIVDA